MNTQICTHRHPSYSIHACMHTPTCKHKHFPVFVLEFMGHLIYRHTRYVWIRDVQNGDRLCFHWDLRRRKETDFIHGERLSQHQGKCCTLIQAFCARQTGKERGGKE